MYVWGDGWYGLGGVGYILNSENVYHFLLSHTIIMPIPIPDQKAGSCALPAFKIQVVIPFSHTKCTFLNVKNHGLS